MDEQELPKRGRGRPKGTTKKVMAERRYQDSQFSTGHIKGSDRTPPVEARMIDDEFLDSEEAAFMDISPASLFTEGGLIAASGGGVIPKLPGTLNLSVPKPNDYHSQLRWAIEYRSLKFIRGALSRRLKFIISGFRHNHEDPKVIEVFDKVARETKFVKALKSIQWEKDTVGWVVAWPDQINVHPQNIGLLQGNIRIERIFGIDRIYLQLDQKASEAIMNNPEGFPSYFVEQIRGQKNTFRREILLQGAYLVSSNRDIGEAYPKSPMYPLFEPVKIIDGLVETEHAISFAVKQLIMHVKVKGELDSKGQQKMATRSQLAQVARSVLNGARTQNVVTDAGVEIEFLSPDKDIFEATKTPYEQAMQRIIDNIGIPMLLVSGKADGISYSTATFIIKGFLQDVISEREDLLTDFVYPWYREIAARLYEEDPKRYAFLKKKDDWNIPTVQFNETELKNIVELLSVLKFLVDTGAYPMESVFEDLQKNFDTEYARKNAQNKDDGWIYKPYEPSQGMSRSTTFENPAQADIEDMRNRLKHDQTTLQVNDENTKAQIQNQADQIRATKLSQAGARPSGSSSTKKASTPARKAPGAAGRPSKVGSTPKSNQENRNPRTAGAMILDEDMEELGYIMGEDNPEQEVTIGQLLDVIDNPEQLDKMLRPRASRFFDKYPGGEI